MASEWQWAECRITHGRGTGRAAIKAELPGAHEPAGDALKLLGECLPKGKAALAAPQEGETETPVRHLALKLAGEDGYASENVGYGLLAFALISDQSTEVYIACNTADIITRVDDLLLKLRDGVQRGHLPRYLPFIPLLPAIARRNLFWPGLQGHVQIRADLLGAKVPIQGRSLSFLGIFDGTTASTLAATTLGGVIAVGLTDAHWAVAFTPLWGAIIAALSKVFSNSGYLFLKKLHWTVSRD